MKRYEYPRYFFSNKSLDILALCCAALDRLGIAHRRPRREQVSVAATGGGRRAGRLGRPEDVT